MPLTDPFSALCNALDIVAMPIAVWGRDCELLHCNAEFERLTGATRDELLGRTIEQLYGAGAWETSERAFVCAFRGETVEFDRLVSAYNPNPAAADLPDLRKARWQRIKLAPASRDERGHVTAVLSTAVDIDDHVRGRDSAERNAGRIQRILSAIALPIGGWDRSNRLVWCNDAYLTWSGQSREALIGRKLSEIYGQGAWQSARQAFWMAYTGQAAEYTRLVTHQNSAHWVRVTVFPDTNPDGLVERVYTIAIDIDDEVRAIEELRDSRRKLDGFTANIPYPLTYFDSSYVYQFVNRAFVERNQLDPSMVIGRKVPEVRGERIWKEHLPYVQAALQGRSSHYERKVRLPDGTERWIRSSYHPDIDEQGVVRGVYDTNIDIDELKRAQEVLARTAERDPLTDAYNRRYLMQHLDAAMEFAEDLPFALVFVDLDGFKGINDTAGHSAGDAVLRTLAVRFDAALKEKPSTAAGICARFGGDEFVLVVPMPSDDDLADLATRIVDLAGAPVMVGKHLLSVSASVGVALAPKHARTAQSLLARADEAMYQVKATGKGRWQMCSSGPSLPANPASAAVLPVGGAGGNKSIHSARKH
ncbi:bifunctional diguanylate cyclase/phosphodiesterase [Piscinibacterium candidicorallinum]|uniref:sensor domain-containing protein n=1 Tax=Piscinibacterium candidicorallinum TaxID=1793872 RepID=UPI0036728B2F